MRKFAVCLAAFALGVALFASMAAAANMALQLKGDPDSFFEAPNSASFTTAIKDHFTIEAWVKPAKTDGENIILNKEDEFELGVNTGTLQTAVLPVGGSWAWFDSGAAVPADQWTHVAMTDDGTTIRLFVGGKLSAETTDWPGALGASPDTFKVGRRTRGGETHSIFTGLVDEVRLSKVVRYSADFAVPTTPFTADADTVALYHFDAADDGTVADASAAHNDGALRKDATLVAAPDLFM